MKRMAALLLALAMCLSISAMGEDGLMNYDAIEPYIHGYACVGENGLFGLINEECDVVIPLVYKCVRTFDYVTIYTDYGYCEVTDDYGTGIYVIEESKLLIPCKYDAVFYEATGTGTYFIGQKYPLVEENDGWWELYDFDVYDIDGNLQYQTKAYYVRFSNDYPGSIEELVKNESTGLDETQFHEIQPNTGNRIKYVCDEKAYVYTKDKERALRKAYDDVFIYYPYKYFIVLKDGIGSFVDIDGNELEKTKINDFEYEWEAIRINGKVYAEY